MAEIKSLLTLQSEAQLKDKPFIDTITADLIILIDDAMAAEIEYKVIYDINATLLTTDGPLQTTRIKNTVSDTLKTKGYRPSYSDVEVSPSVREERLTVAWTVNTLTSSL